MVSNLETRNKPSNGILSVPQVVVCVRLKNFRFSF
jgi:hypothetical protein